MTDISIVIPTYNRAELLRKVLAALSAQNALPSQFEVIVSDDGSSDHTAALTKSYASEWPLKYTFQEDLGYRVAAARNAGARLADSDILVFLDCGTIPGPHFVSSHLSAHRERVGAHLAVVGPVYGYNESIRDTDVYINQLAALSPNEIRAAIPDDTDPRHETYREVDFDIDRLAIPPILYWSGNCSVSSEDFWAVRGFDEEFVGWGMEDVELGYRLWSNNAKFMLARDAWAIELPHPRNDEVRLKAFDRNIVRFLEKNNFAPPSVELWAIMLVKEVLFEIEHYYRRALAWEQKAKMIDVRDELQAFYARQAHTDTIGVFGIGRDVPSYLHRAYLFDFDSEFAGSFRNPAVTVGQSLGVRTKLGDNSLDAILITSRLRGLWDILGEFIEAEANRVARTVEFAWC
jgi:validoxylamine A glucosyltransferase